MKDLSKNRVFIVIICLIVCFLMTGNFSFTQEKSDEDLQKEYVPILGEYTFQTAGGSFTLKFYIEKGDLWADSGDGRPATMEPIEGEVFAFTAEDPASGLFKIKFMKNDQGDYTLCHVSNEDMGLDVEGTKIK